MLHKLYFTMARGSTRSEEVNELTKQIIAESVAEEYESRGITDDINSLFEDNDQAKRFSKNYIGRAKKEMPTIGSWFKRILRKGQENENPDYRFHYSYLSKVMKQYVREYNGQMAYFDGQSTFELLEGTPFINLDISQLEERLQDHLHNKYYFLGFGKNMLRKIAKIKKKQLRKEFL